jgi:hypothetical protein
VIPRKISGILIMNCHEGAGGYSCERIVIL